MAKRPKHRTIAAGEFKATCLALLDEVARSGQTLVVTKRGRPVAQVTAIDGAEPKPLLGSVTFTSASTAPTDEPWDADT